MRIPRLVARRRDQLPTILVTIKRKPRCSLLAHIIHELLIGIVPFSVITHQTRNAVPGGGESKIE